MNRDELARTGQSYRDRHERDLRRHEEMVGYAEGRACRWQTLLTYFGGEPLPDQRCGHCDHCKQWVLQREAWARAKAEKELTVKTGETVSKKKRRRR
jgi:superfamily II DNA helicase RecQ